MGVAEKAWRDSQTTTFEMKISYFIEYDECSPFYLFLIIGYRS